MNHFFRTAPAAACLVLLLGVGAPAQAQTTHTLTIRDGQVWVDEHLVPADELPASLDVQGVQARFTFVGDLKPVIELGEVLYVLDGQRLREVQGLSAAPGRRSLLFRDRAGDDAFRLRYDSRLPQDITSLALMEQSVQELQQHSQELDKLSRQVEQNRNDPLLAQVRAQAQQAAKVAQDLPRLEVQNYFFEMQQLNQDLYGLLLRESQMEAEAHALALDIQRLSDGAERRQRVETLRQKLDAMFEVKQENRRREILQLERDLENLRARLQRREAYRDRIIQQRLDELIGVTPSPKQR